MGPRKDSAPRIQQQGATAPRCVGRTASALAAHCSRGGQCAGPTLQETAGLLRQMGLRDALNLDGGGSTGLMVGGGDDPVLGRGVSASIHNLGLGLVAHGISVADSFPYTLSEAAMPEGDWTVHLKRRWPALELGARPPVAGTPGLMH